ncbi:MAG: Crp/Fnr family transcriptional regulator [Thermoanaerobaculia bacterium]
MPQRLVEPLLKSPFGCAGPDVLEYLAPFFTSRKVAKGAVVFVEGEVDGRFFVIVEGQLKAYRSLPGDRSITVFNLLKGDFFGFIPLLDGGPFPVSVSAVTDCHLFVLSREDFHRVLATHPEISAALLAYTARRLRNCLDQVGLLGHRSAVARVAHALLGLMASGTESPDGVEVQLPSSQAELARSLDINAENISRTLARLCKDGIIERLGSRGYRILDSVALADLAQPTENPR